MQFIFLGNNISDLETTTIWLSISINFPDFLIGD